MLSAHVYDQHGGEGTTTLPVEARDLDGDVLIVPSIEGPEIASLEAAVSEVTFFDHALAERRGLVPRVLMQEDLEYRLVRDFKLLIWSDVGDLGLPIQDRHVRVLNQAYRSGIPLYLMGEHLIAARQGLGREAGTLWSGLTRLDPGADRRPEAAVRLVRDGEGQPDLHPVLSAPFAEVLDFDYPRNLEPGAVNSPQAEVLAVSGGSDVMVAFPSRQLSSAALTGIRAIAQNFRVYPDQNEGFSSEERRALFQNAVCWLIDCDPCLAFNVSLTSSVVPAAVAVGDEVVFTIAAHHNGVCQAGGVVVESVLPENLRFVSAEASQGRVDREGQAVRFRLGILAQASVAEMTIVARALAPGPTAMTASVRANGANLANPVVTEPVAVEGILPPARPPELTIAPGGEGLEIQVMGQPARQYELQQSEDLVRWRGTRLLDSDAEGRVSLIVDASSSRRLFFRVREIR